MNQKLSNVKKKILDFIQEGEKVDRVLDICLSNFKEYEKKELKKMFEDDMRKHRKEAETSWTSDLTYPLSEILRSRLFVYTEPENSPSNFFLLKKEKVVIILMTILQKHLVILKHHLHSKWNSGKQKKQMVECLHGFMMM